MKECLSGWRNKKYENKNMKNYIIRDGTKTKIEDHQYLLK